MTHKEETASNLIRKVALRRSATDRRGREFRTGRDGELTVRTTLLLIVAAITAAPLSAQLIKPDGEMSINSRHNEAGGLVGGLARVRDDRGWGWINREGEFVWTSKPRH